MKSQGSVQACGVAQRETEHDKRYPLPPDDLIQMFYRLELAVSNLNPARENEWEYIPYSHGAFYHKLKSHIPNKKFNYLEVGCGLGTKLYIAKKLLGIYSVTGIEINPNLAAIAKSWFGQYTDESGRTETQYWGEGVKIFNMDAMEFANYADYDLIYTYDPKRGTIPQAEFYAHIMSNMKHGAKLLRARWGGSFSIFVKGEMETWSNDGDGPSVTLQ